MLATGRLRACRLARERGLLAPREPVERGRRDRLRARARRGALRRPWTSSTARNLPAAVPEERFVARGAALRRGTRSSLDDAGREFFRASRRGRRTTSSRRRSPRRRRRGTSSTRAALRERVRERTVAELIEVARAAGGDVRPADELRSRCRRRRSSPSRRSSRCASTRRSRTRSAGSGSTTARASSREDAPVAGLYAAGADAGGIFTGGYGSGLAAALVFGRIAAESALR